MFMDNAMQIINSYNENDALKADLAAANARIAELEQHFEQAKDKIAMMGAEVVRLSEGKEQAEAQCAAMRLRFEKYVRENCKLIRHSVADGLGKPDDVDGKCGGYCQNFDEPHQLCQECIAAYDLEAEYNDEVADAGTAILTENKRLRVCGNCRHLSTGYTGDYCVKDNCCGECETQRQNTCQDWEMV